MFHTCSRVEDLPVSFLRLFVGFLRQIAVDLEGNGMSFVLENFDGVLRIEVEPVSVFTLSLDIRVDKLGFPNRRVGHAMASDEV